MNYVSIPPKGPYEHQFTFSESEAAGLQADLFRTLGAPKVLGWSTSPSLAAFYQMLLERQRA